MVFRRLIVLALVLVAGCSGGDGVERADVLGEPNSTFDDGDGSAALLADDGTGCRSADISTDLVLMNSERSGQYRLGLQFELRDGAAPCMISGHPEVELIGSFDGDRSYEGASCSLRFTSRSAAPTKLESGTYAHAVVTILDDPGGVVPSFLRVELPGSDSGKSFDWPLGTALCHNAATRPGTFVGSIETGPVPTG